MIPVTFKKEHPQGSFIQSIGFYSDHPSFNTLPTPVIESLRLKPHDSAVETLISNGHTFFRHIAVRLGNKNTATRRSREEAGSSLLTKALGGIETTLSLDLRGLDEEGLDLLTGILLSNWRFDKYKTVIPNHQQNLIDEIIVLCNDPVQMEKNFKRRKSIVEGVLYARALTSEPANILFPSSYAEKLKELKELGVGVEILNETMLQKAGMTAMLAVGQGSTQHSYVAILSWNPQADSSPPIVIVGKGVCFDSGGLCLKQTAHQPDMKWDKAGAGAVAGLMKTLALSKTPTHVIGILGLVENMPDGGAIKPGDVIRTMSGQTVEIINTDAEGRLVLADCLWYAGERFKPRLMIDLGTLTMETFASLGNAYAGLYSDNFELASQLKSAGESSGDLLWELPMGEYFAKQIESPVADMKNVGLEFCGDNGAAAEFLKRFVGNIPWAHIDIAGVSWSKEDLPLAAKGVTGFGVRLLEEWIHSLEACI